MTLAILALLAAHPALAAEKAHKGEAVIDGPTYIKLAPIILPVFVGHKLVRQAGLVLALELEPGKTEADIEPNRRKLVDAFITELYGLYDANSGSDRVIESAVVKQRLHETSDRILGPGLVHEVLIEQAYERVRN